MTEAWEATRTMTLNKTINQNAVECICKSPAIAQPFKILTHTQFNTPLVQASTVSSVSILKRLTFDKILHSVYLYWPIPLVFVSQ